MTMWSPDEALRRYQRQIGVLEMPEWEQTVEECCAHSISGAPRKSTKPATGLIDLDLIRGSTFPKAKPRQGLWCVLRSGVLRAVLLPIYAGWWRQHVGPALLAALLLAYTINIISLTLYYSTAERTSALPHITAAEVLTPSIVGLSLSVVKSRMVAFKEDHPRSAESKSAQPRAKRVRAARIPTAGGQGRRCSSGLCQPTARRSTAPARSASEEPVVTEGSGSPSLPARSQSADTPRRATARVVLVATDSADSRSEDVETELCTGRSALRRPARRSNAETPRPRPGSDSSTAEASGSDQPPSRRQRTSCYVKRRLAAGRWRCHRWSSAAATPEPLTVSPSTNFESPNQQTSGSDSDASYGSGGSATSLNRESATDRANWDNPLQTTSAVTDRTGCTIWEGSEVKKVDLTTLDICSVISSRVDAVPQSTDYLIFGLVMAVAAALLPSLCRLFSAGPPALVSVWSLLSEDSALPLRLPCHLAAAVSSALGASLRERVITLGCLSVSLLLNGLLFFLLSVVERAFKQRLLYAKYFCYLTSTRRARKFELPHFRLKKVRNIKTWLSVRSCLKRRGPQRSVDMIASAACLTTVFLVTLLCVELLENTDTPHIDFYRAQLVVWCCALGVFLVRIMSLGSHINRKYRNQSVILTEQINLYLQMEQKPHKKDCLALANNVLKLASDLIKELESPFTILGFSANPFLYNATKLIVLSACSGVLSDMLGFKLKLYKIKLK